MLCEGEESFVGCAAAEGAGTVSGGESGGFVQEEEFGPVAGLHELAVPALKLEFADNPGFVTPAGGDELLLVVVEDAAVASEEATGGISFDGGKGGDAVLERHWYLSLQARSAKPRIAGVWASGFYRVAGKQGSDFKELVAVGPKLGLFS